MIVLDASVVVELLLGTRRGAAARLALSSADDELHAPHLLDVEVTRAVRGLSRVGTIDETRARTALGLLRTFPLHWHAHDGLTERAWELRHNVTVYDGVYLALAEALDCVLLTADAALDAVPGSTAEFRVL